jgi:hypothetical protein
MAIRERKIRRKPPHISYEEFRNAVSGAECCAGAAGEVMTELAVRIARQLEGTAPAAMLEQLLGSQENVPVHGAWHHVLVGEVLLTALRNAGYPISEELVDEVIDRGRQIPGGSCGFVGTCGALASASSTYAILLGSTPVALEARERLLVFHARLQTRLAEIDGSRCCKKSSYAALELAQAELAVIGFALPEEKYAGRCVFCAENATCDGEGCPYFPGG